VIRVLSRECRGTVRRDIPRADLDWTKQVTGDSQSDPFVPGLDPGG
jgi:hypothetical protein